MKILDIMNIPDNISWVIAVATVIYASLTYVLLHEQQKQEKHKKLSFLNMLLGEFKSNKVFLDILNNTLTGVAFKPETWNEFYNVFIGFRDDGWTAFRTQGGLQYLPDKSLYDEIEAYYGSQYKLQKKIQNKIKWGVDREVGFPEGKCYEPQILKNFLEEIKEEINETAIGKNNKDI